MVQFYHYKLDSYLIAANLKSKLLQMNSPLGEYCPSELSHLTSHPNYYLVSCNYEKQTVRDTDVHIAVNFDAWLGCGYYGR